LKKISLDQGETLLDSSYFFFSLSTTACTHFPFVCVPLSFEAFLGRHCSHGELVLSVFLTHLIFAILAMASSAFTTAHVPLPIHPVELHGVGGNRVRLGVHPIEGLCCRSKTLRGRSTSVAAL
jgi:hypothetical protein